jgi:hypothetical protein
MLLGFPSIGRGHRRDVNCSRAGINNGSAGDAKRVDISAGELRSRHWIPDPPGPKLCANSGIQRQHLIPLRGHNQHRFATRTFTHVKRLGVNRPLQRRIESSVPVDCGRSSAGYERIDVQPVAGSIEMVLEDIAPDRHGKCGHRDQDQCGKTIDFHEPLVIAVTVLVVFRPTNYSRPLWRVEA